MDQPAQAHAPGGTDGSACACKCFIYEDSALLPRSPFSLTSPRLYLSFSFGRWYIDRAGKCIISLNRTSSPRKKPAPQGALRAY